MEPFSANAEVRTVPIGEANWTQQQDEVDTVLVSVRYSSPTADECHGEGVFGNVSFLGMEGAGAILNPGVQNGHVGLEDTRFEPESDQARTIALTISDGCTGAQHFTITHVRTVVKAAR
ncbi:MAG: hypothetical protein ACJ762_06345 [Solirubrobacteraceae bacterium]